SSDETRKMLDRAIRLAAVLKRSPAQRAKVLRDLIEKVVIEENAIMMRMRRSSLSGGAVVPPSSKNPSDSPIELTAPVAFRRRGLPNSICRSIGPISAASWRAEGRPATEGAQAKAWALLVAAL